MTNKQTRYLKMNEGPDAFITDLMEGIQLMIDENQDPTKIINNINMVTGFYLQDRDPDVVRTIN